MENSRFEEVDFAIPQDNEPVAVESEDNIEPERDQKDERNGSIFAWFFAVLRGKDKEDKPEDRSITEHFIDQAEDEDSPDDLIDNDGLILEDGEFDENIMSDEHTEEGDQFAAENNSDDVSEFDVVLPNNSTNSPGETNDVVSHSEQIENSGYTESSQSEIGDGGASRANIKPDIKPRSVEQKESFGQWWQKRRQKKFNKRAKKQLKAQKKEIKKLKKEVITSTKPESKPPSRSVESISSKIETPNIVPLEPATKEVVTQPRSARVNESPQTIKSETIYNNFVQPSDVKKVAVKSDKQETKRSSPATKNVEFKPREPIPIQPTNVVERKAETSEVKIVKKHSPKESIPAESVEAKTYHNKPINHANQVAGTASVPAKKVKIDKPEIATKTMPHNDKIRDPETPPQLPEMKKNYFSAGYTLVLATLLLAALIIAILISNS